MATFQPSPTILKRYAHVLVNFALNNGEGIKPGEVVQIVVSEVAKPLYIELRKAVLEAGAHFITRYLPNDEDRFGQSRDFYKLASKEQLTFFPRKYIRGLVDQVDHMLFVISNTNPNDLDGIDPTKMMLHRQSIKPYMEWRNAKENKGKFTWTVGLYGTAAMANEAQLSLKEYWQQIITACYLDKPDPVTDWKDIYRKLEVFRTKLNTLPIDKLHIKGRDVDLWISMGVKRRWQGGSGRNIPSFELFTSPDWRGTEGWIRFNQPLYYMGSLIKDIELVFKKGKVTMIKASKNENLLRQMIATKNADKVGEFSLTDKHFSRIHTFMAETLYDENFGGPQGNTHIALGMAYHDCYDGNPLLLKKNDWNRLGFNDSAVHTDIISTSKRVVTAYLGNGKKRVIYEDGEFRL